MAILLKLEKTEIISVPSILSLILIIKFIIDNKINLKKINAIYHCEAVFKYGTTIMILGNLLILITLVMPKINIEKIQSKQMGIVFSFYEFDNNKVQALLQKYRNNISFSATEKPYITLKTSENDIKEIKEFLKLLN